ncbi:trypsin-like peptidase domain-containing protein [Clostridium sp.]|jgi:serine protease Do|uniref:S1C family serine protease n=1 Tax=Clostridium sp. TaxID=1506 RepID=UPI0025BE12BC|nr:trypsin-like peptidase domain-containing protein [Clostridium sp.]MCI9070075.1 trypsin-like serine protease [Clostridium sp.]
MDNENIYDAAYSEAQLSGENETRYTFNEEIKKGNNRKRKGGMAKYIALALICSLCGGGVGSGITYYLANKNVPLNKASNNIVADPVSFAKDNTALSAADIYKKVAPAVVMISTKSIQSVNGWFQQETEGMGSGFIINTDGYILTNYHVINGAKEVTVTLSDGQEVTASVVNYDSDKDIAMIKLNGNLEVPGVVELGNSDALQPGEEVVAIGNPLSKELSSTLTKGIVSALNRSVETQSGVNTNLIQTDAAINSGNSGGPLINTKGEVIGINTLKASNGAEGIGFAIPINDVKEKIDSLSKPILNLGVSIRVIDEAMSKQLNMEEGLYIVEVNEFSPAEKSGLRGGDLIVKVDGKRIKTFEELQEIKNSKEEGDSMNVEFIRDGKTKNTTINLTSTITTTN